MLEKQVEKLLQEKHISKPDEQFLKDRLSLFESEGWQDLIEELKNLEDSIRDVDTIESEKELWEAKGQLRLIGFILSLESTTKIAVEQSETTPL